MFDSMIDRWASSLLDKFNNIDSNMKKTMNIFDKSRKGAAVIHFFPSCVWSELAPYIPTSHWPRVWETYTSILRHLNLVDFVQLQHEALVCYADVLI